MEPFTLRHEKALVDKRLKVSIPPRLRERLWQLILSRNEHWEVGWHESTSHLEETEKTLKQLLGRASLVAKTLTGAVEGLEAYFREGYPSNVLEVVEQFHEQLTEQDRKFFAKAVNEAMQAFKCPWLLLEGTFYKIEDQFLGALVETSHAALVERGFTGAVDEMREARDNLTANRPKEAIVAALKSVESTAKTILGSQSGVAKELFIRLREAGFMNDIPVNSAKAIVGSVLPSIAVLRNELGGHGQGPDIVNVPQSYAFLAVHLASAINLFLLEQTALQAKAQTPQSVSPPPPDDDCPF
jgi:hypothetical protein